MNSVHDQLRQRLLERAGLADPPPPPFTREQAEKLYESERLAEFEKLMLNRLVMGALRYGPLAGGHHDKHGYFPCVVHDFPQSLAGRPGSRRIASAIKRLIEYQQTGNQEHLVDAANLCGIEFEYGNHPQAHFEAIDRKD